MGIWYGVASEFTWRPCGIILELHCMFTANVCQKSTPKTPDRRKYVVRGYKLSSLQLHVPRGPLDPLITAILGSAAGPGRLTVA
jgi:hypothetical protein